MAKLAVYPGSFDPVTYGHIDLIKRASQIFDEVWVSVAQNTQKQPLFTTEERVAMIKEATKGIKGVKVESFEGLLINYVKSKGSHVLLRGLRAFLDFEFEFQMALTNRRFDGSIETVFLMPSEGLSFTSSTLLKEAAALGADVSSFVPECVIKKLKEKFK